MRGKRLKTLLLTGVVLLTATGLMGCGGKTESGQNNTKAEQSKESPKEEKKEDVTPVTIEQIPYDIKILEPDSTGTRYMETAYTNKSKITIKGVNITVLLKDSNEKVYLSNYDTVLPGETSPIFNAFAPKSGDQKDMEILKIEITTVNDDGSNTHIEYDAKLKTYELF